MTPRLALVLAVLAPVTTARAEEYAPLNQPGPALTVPAADLEASLVCTDDVRNAARAPVLLLSGTAIDSKDMYGWNVERALRAMRVPFCTSDQQGALRSNMDDLQIRGDYVTYAIRAVRTLAGRPIVVLGHSQGGMIARWSLRFWPDTRPMVEELIGVAADNGGTTAAGPACTGGCAASFRQQAPDAHFMTALNSQARTFPGIDYTEIYTRTDELVQPPGETSPLPGPGRVSNVAVQDVCPTDNPDHMAIGTVDPVSWSLIVDALEHPGPADPKRIPMTACAGGVMPGVDDATAADDIALAGLRVAQAGGYRQVPAEPALRCYATATCPAPTPRPAGCRTHRRLRVPRRFTRVTGAGRRLRVRKRHGRRFVGIDLRYGTVVVRMAGRTAGGRRVRRTIRLAGCV